MFVVAATTAPHPGGVICSPSSHRMADSTLTNWSTRRCQTTNIQPLTGLVRGADSIYKHSTPDGVVSRSVSSKCPNSSPPTALVGLGSWTALPACRPSMNDPPTTSGGIAGECSYVIDFFSSLLGGSL